MSAPENDGAQKGKIADLKIAYWRHHRLSDRIFSASLLAGIVAAALVTAAIWLSPELTDPDNTIWLGAVLGAGFVIPTFVVAFIRLFLKRPEITGQPVL
jgi:ABC-type cobalamin transport system permease subunit